MGNTNLTLDEIIKYIERNKYEFDKDKWMLSRCIDGRYAPSKDLEPLAKPGADAGDLLSVLSLRKKYSLSFKNEDLAESMIDLMSGATNIRFHTDNHSDGVARGCGHLKQASLYSIEYFIDYSDVDFVFSTLQRYKSEGAKEVILEGGHLERAVIIVDSDYFSVQSSEKIGDQINQAFIYQRTLDNRRRQLLIEFLLPIIYGSFKPSKEYLYQVLSEVSNQQLMMSVNKLAKGLPVYEVMIDKNGSFNVIKK